jgi:hypothetical protein
MRASALPLVFIIATGCKDASDTSATATTSAPKTAAKPAPTSHASSSPSGDVTIEGDGKGGFHVKGGSHLKGSAHACKAYKTCCSQKDLSLFCGMLEATEKGCEGALTQVKQYAKEARIRTPAGCD